MQIPGALFIRKKPAMWKCPACPQTFDVMSYPDKTPSERVEQAEKDYLKHFKDSHSH
jgi:ribosomal protein L37AE/L43A